MARALRAVAHPRWTVLLALALLSAGLVTLGIAARPLPRAGVAAAEAVALQALGVGAWLVSPVVHLLALALGVQVGVRWLTQPGPGPLRPAPLVAVTGILALALTLGGGLYQAAEPAVGELRLRPGEPRESCNAVVAGQPTELFMGRWVRLVRWDAAAGVGEVALRAPGGEERSLPLRVGQPLDLGALELVPIARRVDLRPVTVHVQWRPRAGGDGGRVALRPGQHVHLDSTNEVVWEDFQPDLAGLGPAVLVVHHGAGDVEDRRWLLLQAPDDHEQRQRSGPMVLRPVQVERGEQLLLRVRRAAPGWPLPVGLLLLLVTGLLDAWGSRRPPRARAGAPGPGEDWT